MSEFKQRGCEIVGVSVDSEHSHRQWLNQPRNQGGIQGTEYPLLSDMKKQASRDYGVLHEGKGISLRGLFIINPEGVVEVEMINNFPIGRSSDEILRLVDAAQESKKGMVCPMNFAKGKEAINPKEAKTWFAKNAK